MRRTDAVPPRSAPHAPPSHPGMAAGTSDSVLGGASAAHPTSRVTFEPEVEARLKAYQEELAEAKAMLAKKDEVIAEVKAENAKKDEVIADVRSKLLEALAQIKKAEH